MRNPVTPSQKDKIEQPQNGQTKSTNSDEQQRPLKHQPLIRRVSSNSSTSSSGSGGAAQDGGAPLPIVMQNIPNERTQPPIGERVAKTSTSGSSTSSSGTGNGVFSSCSKAELRIPLVRTESGKELSI